MSASTVLVGLGGFGGLAAVLGAVLAFIRLPSDRGTAAVTQAQGAGESLERAAKQWEALTKSAELRAAAVSLERDNALTRIRELEAELAGYRRAGA